MIKLENRSREADDDDEPGKEKCYDYCGDEPMVCNVGMPLLGE